MKVFNNVFRVLTVVFGVTALALFLILDFGQVVTKTGEIARTGAQFAFGSKFEGAAIGKSSDLLLCMITTALSVLFGALSFKYKKTRWAACGFAGFTAIYMLVVTLSDARVFLDTQGFTGVVTANYLNNAPLFITIALGLCFVAAVAYLLISDKLACAENGELTIPKRFVKFLKDYKGEIKKIVWPGWRAVLKNTLIVLIMCAILGLIIFAVDFGLGNLVKLILGQ